ncbi:hypothetical protein KVR01_006366 [Diaporthe batatas]|uniref:uncharacterized protein n=1 Tax=Diaporthe batatas TaxID=748121 RepID=UPI001D047CC8|nr:uncharacterized protein KVR01_006366 [Diaporthe batatas]KAG8164448.1 hypothetical protein KVR01_006366 [Diaporthe batatas]
MKAFTAVIAMGSLLSVSLASPLNEVSLEERASYTADDLAEHHAEARQLPGLPPVPIPTKPVDIIPALQTILKQTTAVLNITQAGLPPADGFPALPALPIADLSLPGLPLLPAGTVSSPADIVNQLSSIQSLIDTVHTILSNLPTGTSLDQLKQALALAGQIRTLAAPIVERIQALGQNGIIQLPANVVAISDSLSDLLSLINLIQLLLGPTSSLIPIVLASVPAAA